MTQCWVCGRYSRHLKLYPLIRGISTFMKDVQFVDVDFGNTGSLRLKTGQLARLADGSVTAQLGESAVFVAVVAKSRSIQANFVPLTVDYRQKATAAGRIPTNFLRRELGPNDQEILISRMIDRSIRPFFPTGYSLDTQITCNLIAFDGTNQSDVMAINAASAALSLSDIPWNGPVGAVRVGHVDGEILINPTKRELNSSRLNLIIAGSIDSKVVMMEGACERLPDYDLELAIMKGLQAAKGVATQINEFCSVHGKSKRVAPTMLPVDNKIIDEIRNISHEKLLEIFQDYSHNKLSRDLEIRNLKEKVWEQLKSIEITTDYSSFTGVYDNVVKSTFRDLISTTNKRCDGRALTELRPIHCAVGLQKRLHGSALFQRGQTQVMCAVTFDSSESAVKTDAITAMASGIKEKNFFLHYEFPPYANNELGSQSRAYSRRELGHGALAEKALRPVVPQNYPFTIRLTSEVMESNGSSSMASVSGGSLALMDAGVPLLEPAAGLAMGVITHCNEDGEVKAYRLLTDQMGMEDYLGDMDFKIAGTSTGVTALQLDVKLPGMPVEIILEALQQGAVGRKQILQIMSATLNEPRKVMHENLPALEIMELEASQQRLLLTARGFQLRRITEETGVSINFCDINKIELFAPNPSAMCQAREMLNELIVQQKEPEFEFGAVINAKITELRDYGVMVQLHPSMKSILLHNSQLDQRNVHHPSVLGLEVDQEIKVKYFGRDPVSGQIRLSRKVLQGIGKPRTTDFFNQMK